jgi:hypothetical protein
MSRLGNAENSSPATIIATIAAAWRTTIMKFMATWTVVPGTLRAAVDRFLAGEGTPAGVTLLGRWHQADCNGGFALYETENAAALFEGGAKWADVLVLHTVPVVEDADAAAGFAKVFKK